MNVSQKYARLIEQQKASGLSVKRFCSNEGIAPSNFYYWQKKLLRSSKVQGFVPLVIKSTPELQASKSEESLLEIAYPNGITLRIKQDLDLVRLRALLSLLD